MNVWQRAECTLLVCTQERVLSQALIFGAVVRPSNTFKNEEKWSGMLPKHLGRGAEVLERVFEVFSPRATNGAPRSEKCVTPFSFSKSTRVYPFLCIPLF